MRYETAKKASDIKLDGVKVELEFHDKSVRTVILTDGAGNECRITKDGSYSENVKVLIPEQPKEVKVYAVSGKLLGITDFREEFDQRHLADSRLSALQSETGIYDADKLGLAVIEETVLRQDAA